MYDFFHVQPKRSFIRSFKTRRCILNWFHDQLYGSLYTSFKSKIRNKTLTQKYNQREILIQSCLGGEKLYDVNQDK